MTATWVPLTVMVALCLTIVFSKARLPFRLAAGAVGFFLALAALADFFSPRNWLGILVLFLGGVGFIAYAAWRRRHRRAQQPYGRHAFHYRRH